jgi:ribonuclease VapC
MFLDASVMLANLLDEPEAADIRLMLSEEMELTTSPLAMFETSARLAVIRRSTIERAYQIVLKFVDGSGIAIVPIGAEIGREAHICAARYHHSTGHPARLNMGDCFAYAGARSTGLKLAYKGNDFIHTDIDGVRFGP